MKNIFLIFLLLPFFVNAQDKFLMAEGVTPNLYLIHKVAAKENYYSIGRLYNISPKDIAPFNKLKLDGGLNLGQDVKIPLNNSNFFQSGNADDDETFVPVYYSVKDKEGLYRVAVNHNNLALDDLKKWNNIKGDAVKSGTRLIVGYLKVKKDLSALSANGIGTFIGSKTVAVADEKKAPSVITVKKDPVVQTQPAIITETPKAVKIAESENNKTVTEKSVPEPKKSPVVDNKNSGAGFNSIYQSQVNGGEIITVEGLSGTFKSTSGWTDKKYYCLHNQAPPGTIIKITNPSNGKVVYAKVLDMMPDIKQNEGLVICISNAAADALGATDNRYTCVINYSK